MTSAVTFAREDEIARGADPVVLDADPERALVRCVRLEIEHRTPDALDGVVVDLHVLARDDRDVLPAAALEIGFGHPDVAAPRAAVLAHADVDEVAVHPSRVDVIEGCTIDALEDERVLERMRLDIGVKPDVA